MRKSRSEASLPNNSINSALANTRYKSLPQNFADLVLSLELRLQRECTIAVINQLLEFYSKAVEYYESKNDERYLDYHKRIQDTLMKPEVIKAMSSDSDDTSTMPSTSNSMSGYQQSPTLKTINYKSATNEDFEKIVKNHQLDSENSLDIISREFEQQKNSFEQRLLNRKRKKMGSRALSTSALDKAPGLDKSEINRLLGNIAKDNEKESEQKKNNDSPTKQTSGRKDSTDSDMSNSSSGSPIKKKGVDMSKISKLINDDSDEEDDPEFAGVGFDTGSKNIREHYMEDPSDSDEEEALNEAEVEKQIEPVWDKCQELLEDIARRREEAIEVIYKAYIHEKETSITKLKSEYEKEIQGLEEKGASAIMNRVIEKLKKDQKESLKKAINEIDSRLQEKLTQAKEEFDEERRDAVDKTRFSTILSAKKKVAALLNETVQKVSAKK